jgi:UPF0042 nucleotide-binding protein
VSMIRIISFSYRNRPDIGAVELDCRSLWNPHNDPTLRKLTGLDAAVQEVVECDPQAKELLVKAHEAVGCGDSLIAFGCYGGKHRSVAMAELFAAELRVDGNSVQIEHRALQDH